MVLEITQYKTRPLGKVKPKITKKMGIIHSIMRWVLCCRGSVDGCMAIFCWIHMVAPASAGRIGRPSRVSG